MAWIKITRNDLFEGSHMPFATINRNHFRFDWQFVRQASLGPKYRVTIFIDEQKRKDMHGGLYCLNLPKPRRSPSLAKHSSTLTMPGNHERVHKSSMVPVLLCFNRTVKAIPASQNPMVTPGWNGGEIVGDR
jgi:hypothetical protein